MTKMAAMPIYGKNPSKIFFSGTGRTDYHETWYVASDDSCLNIVCSNDDPGVDLDLFYGKVKFGNKGFSLGKSENCWFFRTIAACDLKLTA